MSGNEIYKSALLFGPPGVGKGTQGQLLGCIPGFFHFSMGEAFRNLDPESDLGQTVAGYSTRGDLVPDEITVELWRQSMRGHTEKRRFNPATDLLLLDGVPRTLSQAQLLDGAIDVLQVVHLVSENESVMLERLRRRALRENRADDAREEVVRRRWQVYREETQPVLDHYPSAKTSNVDPEGTPAEVLERVLQVLAPIQSRHFANALEHEA